MQPDDYRALTHALHEQLAADPRVLGLVALGSMAERDYQPDRWSDHDFFVIVEPGMQEAFRADLAWLPRHTDIALAYRETAHGLKVVYADGHLLEFAVFDPAELALARVNRYRVLLDRGDITGRMAEIAAATHSRRATMADDHYLFGQFLTNLLVGFGRFQRGEVLSGRRYVQVYAVEHLLTLLAKQVPASRKELLDNVDPFRRFEHVFPHLGAEINAILKQDVDAAALGLLELARRELRAWLTPELETGFDVIGTRIAHRHGKVADPHESPTETS